MNTRSCTGKDKGFVLATHCFIWWDRLPWMCLTPKDSATLLMIAVTSVFCPRWRHACTNHSHEGPCCYGGAARLQAKLVDEHTLLCCELAKRAHTLVPGFSILMAASIAV